MNCSGDGMEKECINTYDQLCRACAEGILPKKHLVAITFVARVARGCTTSRWLVYSPWERTDPTAHWSNNGQKMFFASNREEKAENLVKAQEWVKSMRGYAGPWKRNGMGDYVPAVIADRFKLLRLKRSGEGHATSWTE